MTDPVEVSVRKAVRKTDVAAGGEQMSFEFTGERVLILILFRGLCSGACASALAPGPLGLLPTAAASSTLPER